MKFNKWTLGLAAVMSLALFTPTKSPAQITTYMDGTNNAAVNVAGSAIARNAIPAAATNYFNLSLTPGEQSNTNLWPAVTFPMGNIYNPSRLLELHDQWKCSGANAGIITTRWAGTDDGTHWQTNPCPFIVVETANGTAIVSTLTNYDTGAMLALALFSEENTNASAYVTNRFRNANTKRGF